MVDFFPETQLLLTPDTIINQFVMNLISKPEAKKYTSQNETRGSRTKSCAL